MSTMIMDTVSKVVSIFTCTPEPWQT